jgi:tRNA (uracil-5-)-methyltransferase TRM9
VSRCSGARQTLVCMIGFSIYTYGSNEPRVGSDIAAAYELYFSSGLYDHRYPAPNPHTMASIVREIAQRGPSVLDFGCGSGRYAAPLAALPGVTVLAYDVCSVALAQLRQRHASLVADGRIVPVGFDIEALAAHIEAQAAVDVGLMAFGVLGHIPGRAARRDTLRRIRSMLRAGGRLVLSVPNAARRFRLEQRHSRGNEPGDVDYVRHSASGPVRLFYHVYHQDELAADLEAAGLHVIEIEAESVLPERIVASSAVGAGLDRLLRVRAPRSHAYGFLAIAERPASAP